RILFSAPAVAVGKRLKPFIHVPTIILAPPNNIDLFVPILPNVPRPKFTRKRVEAESPRLAQAHRPNLWPHISSAHKRIIRRNRIRSSFAHMVDVNAQHLSQEQHSVLAMTFRVLLWPGIAHPNIKKSVWTKLPTTAVMHAGHLLQFQDAPRRPSGVLSAVRACLALNDVGRKLALLDQMLRIVIFAVLFKIRMQRHTQQSAR